MARPKEFDQSLVLDQAMDTFWERGFDGTAVRDLCEAMALNSGSLYGAFGDKRALFLAALDRYIDTVSREAAEQITGAPSGLAGIRAFFDFLIDAMQSGKRRWGCLVTNSVAELACRDPEIAAKAKLQLTRLERSFSAALERARSAGEIAPDIGVETATFLVCVVQGLNILAKTGPSRDTLQRVVEVALKGLGTPPERHPAVALQQ
jgi:TetR/AcrR family transcriptional repressor of nem operon